MTGLIYSEAMLEHETGPGHPERPPRLTAVYEALERSGLLAKLEPLAFQSASREALTRVHEPRYIDRVTEAASQGRPWLDTPDCPLSAATAEAAGLASGGVIAAVDAVLPNRVRNAFCAVRPPGHHAEVDRAMGFCFFNHVVVAAAHAIERHGLKRVAIVDFDVHHGNGTQHLFEHRSDVLFISLHEDPTHLFPGTGFAHECGTGQGRGYTVNIPMPPGSGDDAYSEAVNQQLLPRLESFEPELLLVSAGFDAAAADPLAHQQLTASWFGWITRQLQLVADRFAAGRLVSTLEGGYDLDALGDAVTAHVEALLQPPAESRE